MKFKIFKLHELIYKYIAYVLVFIITVGCVYCYKEGERNVYLLSLFYALFLFMISVYMNYMSTKVQNMFYRRKDQYKSLKRLEEMYNRTFSDKDDLLSFVTIIQGMTGRSDNGLKPFITFNGFEYTKRYLKLEESYVNLSKELIQMLNNEIQTYIATHKLNKGFQNVFVINMSKFFPEVNGWVNNHLNLSEEEKIHFINFIKDFRKLNRKKFKRLSRLTNKIKKMIKRTNEKCLKNLVKIEEIYGEMLFETLDKEDALYNHFIVLENLIQDLKGQVLTYTDFEEILNKNFERIYLPLEDFSRRLDLIKEEVEEISNTFNSNF